MRSIRLSCTLALAISHLSAAGCGTDDPGTSSLQTIMSTDDGEINVELLAENDLAIGRTLVWYRVTDASDGNQIADATVTQTPLMVMMDFSHSCPEVDPAGPANSDGLYPAKIVFTMPTSADGAWNDTIIVTRAGETTEHTLVLENLPVADADHRKTFEFAEGADTFLAFVTLNNAAAWTAGENPYILTVHYRKTMMDFPPMEDVTVSVTVTPAGGTPVDAAAPTLDIDGEYLGSIDLPETGTYAVTFTFTRSGSSLGSLTWERSI